MLPANTWRGQMVEKFARFRAKYGMYDTEFGTVHAEDCGVTLCGVRVGGENRGWFRADRRYEVTCKRCLKRIERCEVSR